MNLGRGMYECRKEEFAVLTYCSAGIGFSSPATEAASQTGRSFTVRQFVTTVRLFVSLWSSQRLCWIVVDLLRVNIHVTVLGVRRRRCLRRLVDTTRSPHTASDHAPALLLPLPAALVSKHT